MKILLCVNGAPTTRPAIAYSLWLAALLEAEVTLLGVVEDPAQRLEVDRLLDETSREIEERHIPYERITREGPNRLVIPTEAAADEYLTVVGPMGRPPLRRMVRGRSIRRLLAAVESPLVYVRQAREKLERVLLCLGGIGHGEQLLQVTTQLSVAGQASVTLLHVVEPVTFEYPASLEAVHTWEALAATDTPQARHLRASFEALQAAGLEVTPVVREGYAVQEILKEARRQDFDLVSIGSHYAASGLRPLYTPNVSIEVAEAAGRPVLIAR